MRGWKTSHFGVVIVSLWNPCPSAGLGLPLQARNPSLGWDALRVRTPHKLKSQGMITWRSGRTRGLLPDSCELLLFLSPFTLICQILFCAHSNPGKYLVLCAWDISPWISWEKSQLPSLMWVDDFFSSRAKPALFVLSYLRWTQALKKEPGLCNLFG